jgi:hypothetical protein
MWKRFLWMRQVRLFDPAARSVEVFVVVAEVALADLEALED